MLLRYLAFSGFEITVPTGQRIVVDPFLTGSTAHGIPPSPVSLSELKETDVVLVSHGAFDHLGQAIEIVKAAGALLACGPDVRQHALSEGVPDERIAYLLSGCTLKLGYATIKALDVRHISMFESHGRWLSGQPLSFMIEVPGSLTIYHSGDTSLFSDLRLFGDLYQPDIALICVGGVRSHDFEVVPLLPREAALAVEWLGVRAAIPMHYRPDSEAAEAFAGEVAARNGASVRIMVPGERVDLSKIVELDRSQRRGE